MRNGVALQPLRVIGIQLQQPRQRRHSVVGVSRRHLDRAQIEPGGFIGGVHPGGAAVGLCRCIQAVELKIDVAEIAPPLRRSRIGNRRIEKGSDGGAVFTQLCAGEFDAAVVFVGEVLLPHRGDSIGVCLTELETVVE